MVGATVLLACALGTVCLKRGQCANGLASTTNTEVEIEHVVAGRTPTQTTIHALSEIIKNKESIFENPVLYLDRNFAEIYREVFLAALFDPTMPPMLRKLMYGAVTGEGYSSQSARVRGERILYLLDKKWLNDKYDNYDLGIMLLQIYIHLKRRLLCRSVYMAVLHGDKNKIIERVLDALFARLDKAALESAKDEMDTLLTEQRMDFNKLRSVAAKLEMMGKEGEAIEMLQEAWEIAEKVGQPQEAYELEMLLVEMLIYKGEYRKALKRKCLNDEHSQLEERGFFYKAIVYTILGDDNQAKKFYEELQEIWRSSPDPNKGSRLCHELEDFKYIVGELKKEIELAHRTTT